MTLYESWMVQAYTKEGQTVKKLWDDYMPQEQAIYEDIIGNKQTQLKGTPITLGERYNMPPAFICGFIDGINDALETPVNIEELAEEQEVVLDIDFERLYKKMVEYKASHLYTLPEWDGVFTPERQKELYHQQKISGTIVKEKTPSRNDPCPCGSGKKYKKCCGAVSA